MAGPAVIVLLQRGQRVAALAERLDREGQIERRSDRGDLERAGEVPLAQPRVDDRDVVFCRRNI